MVTAEAYSQILQLRNITRLEREMLQHMARTSGEDHVCYLTQAKLAELCETDDRSIRKCVDRLEAEGLLVVLRKRNGARNRADGYIPYPYSEDMIQRKNAKGETVRLVIQPESGPVLLGFLQKQEAELSILARAAQDRNDRLEHKRLCELVDIFLDLIDATQRFVDRHPLPDHPRRA